VKRVVVIATRTGIGNAVLLTPLLQSLKKQLPSVRTYVIVGNTAVAELLEGAEFIDRLLIFRPIGAGAVLGGLRYFLERVRPLKPDLCIRTPLESSFDFALFALLSGAPYRASHCNWLDGSLDTWRLQTTDAIHEVEQHLKLLKHIGFRTENLVVTARIPVSEDARTQARSFLAAHSVGDRDFVLGIHVGSGKAQEAKRWPATRFAEIADRFRDLGAQVVVFGGPDDREVIGEFQRAVGATHILATRQTLAQSAALIERCDIFLSNDSGLMHIAAAVGTPVVAIFGPTIPSKNRPWRVPHILVRKELDCSPCYDAQATCPISCDNRVCLLDLTAEEVLNGICQLCSAIKKGHDREFVLERVVARMPGRRIR